MIQHTTLRPQARLDLMGQFIYFCEEANVELAERYFAAVDKTCCRLKQHPRSGTVYHSGIAQLNGLRRLPVSGFDNYLIFYLTRKNGIEVIRILHGARDIAGLFAGEEG